MFVLTILVNDYSQHGEYFIGVFDTIESAEKAGDNFKTLTNHDELRITPVRVNKAYTKFTEW